MWNGRKYAAMAIAGAALTAATSSPALAQYLDNGYAGVYGFGWPYAAYGDYGPYASDYGSYRSASYLGRESARTIYVITLAQAPGRPCPVIHRHEPKRLE
jgi:hypothetical protein